MNKTASNAYAQAQKSAISPRAAEAIAFTQAAVKLDQAKLLTHDYDAFSNAVKSNQRLWTVVQADILEGNNQLNKDLQQKLLDLSVFVDEHSLKALAHPRANQLDPLIEINKNIANGLRIPVDP
jgi:flagellar biosynthesis activator protein FlaF